MFSHSIRSDSMASELWEYAPPWCSLHKDKKAQLAKTNMYVQYICTTYWKLKIKWTSRERLWGCHNSRENFWRTLSYLCMRCLCSYRCFCFCWCRRTKLRKISTYAFQIREYLYVSIVWTHFVFAVWAWQLSILPNVPNTNTCIRIIYLLGRGSRKRPSCVFFVILQNNMYVI